MIFLSSQASLSSKESKKNRRFWRNSCVDVFIESGAILDSLEVQKERKYKKLEFATATKIVTRFQKSWHVFDSTRMGKLPI